MTFLIYYVPDYHDGAHKDLVRFQFSPLCSQSWNVISREQMSLCQLEHGNPIMLLRCLWFPGRSHQRLAPFLSFLSLDYTDRRQFSS